MMKKIEPIETDKKGQDTINLDCDAANADWIRAARLLKRANGGDEQAREEFRNLEDTPMYQDEEV